MKKTTNEEIKETLLAVEGDDIIKE